MALSLHIANKLASPHVCVRDNDRFGPVAYTRAMPKAPRKVGSRTRPVIEVGWYLREWMESLHVSQADMVRKADWSKTLVSHLYNRQKDFTPKLVREGATALGIRPYELFLPPEEANHIRRLRFAVEEEHRLRLIASADTPEDPPAPDAFDVAEPVAIARVADRSTSFRGQGDPLPAPAGRTPRRRR